MFLRSKINVGSSKYLISVAGAMLVLGGAYVLSPSYAYAAYSDSQVRAVESEDEIELNRIRDQEINQLKIVLGRRATSNRRPDLLLRLAELYIEKYRHYFLKENEVHQVLIRDGRKPKKVDHTRSRQYLSSATNACLAILKSKVRFSQMDQVYYFLGYNADELGNKSEAVKYYRKVIVANPASQYTPEAERNIAENEFAKGNFKEALRWYERTARHTTLPSYPRNLYKLAWAYFKNRRYNDALSTMKRVAQIANADDKYLSLKEEALNDLVSFYAEAGRVNEASSYFESITDGPELYMQALKRLSAAYDQSGRRALALQVNQAMINAHGDDQPNLTFDVLAHNVELFRKLKQDKNEDRALRTLVDFFRKHKDDIGKNSDERAAAFSRVKAYLRGRATETHKTAQKSKKDTREQYSRAADLYGLYIQAFLDDADEDALIKERSEVRIYRADSLLLAGREDEAMNELEVTMKEDGDKSKRRESGVTLLNLYIKKIDTQVKSNKRDRAKEEAFFSLSKIYEDLFPGDALIPDLRYKKARLLALNAENSAGKGGVLPDEARDAFEDFITRYPSRKESAEAVRELVAADLRENKQDEAVERAQLYLTNVAVIKAGTQSNLKQYLESVIARKSFTEIQSLEAGNDFQEAAQKYLALAASTKDDEVKVKSLNNAAVNFERAGLRREAMSTYEKILGLNTKSAKSTHASDALKSIATKALLAGEYNEAAQYYAHFTTLNAFSDQQMLSFAKIAIELKAGAEDYSGAYALGKTMRTRFCSGKKQNSWCGDLPFTLAQYALDANDPQASANELKSYAADSRAPRIAEARYKLARLYERFGEDAKMRMYEEEAARGVTARSSREEKSYAAHALFNRIEPEFVKFKSINISGGGAAAKAKTREKLTALERLGSQYSRVVALGDGEWGIAALERLAEAFDTFAAEIQSQPPPEGLNPEGLMQYRKAIAGVTGPMHNRALESLTTAYKKGLSLDVTTPVFIRITQALARKDFARYPLAHVSGQVRLTLMGVQSNDIESWRKALTRRGEAIQGAVPSELWLEYGNLEALAGRYNLARLFYEQALSVNSKNAAALNNLAVVDLNQGQAMLATAALKKTISLVEFAIEPKLNLARVYAAHHLYPNALEALKPLVRRAPKEGQEQVQQEISLLHAVSELGTGHTQASCLKILQMGGLDSADFTLWYNASICGLISTRGSQKIEARDTLKDRRVNGALEREMVNTALSYGEGGS